MAFRDDLDAMRARNERLEADLSAAQERIAELEAKIVADHAEVVERARPKEQAPKPPRERTSRRLGRIHYHAPRTYVPMLALYRQACRAAFARTPSLKPLVTDNVLIWLLHRGLLTPFVYGIRLPAYCLSLCILLPWAAIVCAAGTVILVPVVAASRFSFSSDRPADDTGWFHGHATRNQGATFLWIVMSMSLFPLLITCTTLLEED